MHCKKVRAANAWQMCVLQKELFKAKNYAFMLYNLMALIQEYLLLTDDNKQRAALNSLRLVGSTARLHEDIRICIWLEDVWSEP